MSILIADFQYKRGIRRHLLDNDITYSNIDGVITFSDEVLALQLIDAYIPLATVRKEAKTRVINSTFTHPSGDSPLDLI